MKFFFNSTKVFLVTFFIFCISNSTFSQKWTSYLSTTQTNAFIESKSGIIWAATGGGIVCFNSKGEITTNYTINDGLPSNEVSCIVEDKDKNIWVGTTNGIGKFDGKSWVTFNNKTNSEIKNGIKSILVDRTGVLWFGYSGGIFNYDGKIWGNSLTIPKDKLEHSVYDLIQDKNGNIWAGVNLAYAYKYDGKSWVQFGNKDLPQSSVYCLYEDKAGKIWFGTLGGGAASYDGKTWIIYNESNKVLSYNYVSAIYEDKVGNIWFGHLGSGFTKFDGKTGTAVNQANKNVIDDYATDILQTIDETLWFGTRYGISKLAKNEWTQVAVIPASIPSNNIYSSIIDNTNNLVLGTANGLSLYDGKKWDWLNVTNSKLINNDVRSLTQDKEGNYWFGTRAGLNKYDGKNWTLYNTSNSGISDNFIRTIVVDKDGILWLGGSAGVSKFDGKKWTTFNTQNSSLLSNTINNIIQDKDGNIWVATSDGLAKYDSKTWVIYNVASGAPASTFQGLIQDQDGNIWVGATNRGVYKFDGKNWKSFAYNSNTGEGELYDNTIMAIFQDKNKNVWVGTSEGISKFNGNSWEKYNTSISSIPSSAPIQCITQDSKGLIWFGTEYGLYQLFINCTDKNPNITLQADNQKINEKQNATFLITATDVKTFQWQISANNGVSWQNIASNDTIYNGQNSEKLIILNAKLSQNSYKYRCILSNGCASINSKEVVLTVLCSALIPSITKQVNDQNVVEGQPAIFEVTANNVKTYEWQISIDKGVSWKVISSSDTSYKGQITDKLTLKKAILVQNNYKYRCLFTNDCAGSVLSESATLTVKCADKLPIITSQPKSQTIPENTGATFEVIATEAKSYLWQESFDKGITWRNIVIIDTTVKIIKSNKLILKSVLLGNSNITYRCQISNNCYTINSDAVLLKVTCNRSESIFTTQAKNQSVYENQKAVFSTSANNAVSYIWMVSSNQGNNWQFLDSKDTTYLGQQSNTLTIKSTKKTQDGYKYRCITSNGCSPLSVSSETYSLEVKCGPPSSIQSQPENQKVLETQEVSFQVSGTDVKSFQWQLSKDKGVTWQNISNTESSYVGQQTNNLKIKSALLSQNDFRYRCQLINGCSSIFSNAVTLLVTAILSVDNDPQSTILIYPNPATNFITIKSFIENDRILVVDSKGVALKEFTNLNIIPISDLSEGFYFIRIENSKGNFFQKIQIIK